MNFLKDNQNLFSKIFYSILKIIFVVGGSALIVDVIKKIAKIRNNKKNQTELDQTELDQPELNQTKMEDMTGETEKEKLEKLKTEKTDALAKKNIILGKKNKELENAKDTEKSSLENEIKSLETEIESLETEIVRLGRIIHFEAEKPAIKVENVQPTEQNQTLDAEDVQNPKDTNGGITEQKKS